MSELINNREERQKVMKELILELHNGKSVEEVKERFRQLITGIDATEISRVEQALISEGLPVDEVKRLCDVHTAVFVDSLEEQPKVETIPGHPVHTFKQENREIEKVIRERIQPAAGRLQQNGEKKEALLQLREGLNLLADVDKHYSRKENLLFPYLEKYGVSGPSSVMWGVQDDIRVKLKETLALSGETETADDKREGLLKILGELTGDLESMIYKEENILFPMCLELLSEDEWGSILEQSPEIGYCLIEPETQWKPARTEKRAEEQKDSSYLPKGYLKFETGILTLEEISLIFNHLPVDITFVDKDDVVKYFSQGKERIFMRSKAVIGRKVQNCHPPASVHVVEKIVQEFKDGKRDEAGFWIQMQGMFIYIRYFAVRDAQGKYMGTLEVSQNIKGIKELEGENRLLDDIK